MHQPYSASPKTLVECICSIFWPTVVIVTSQNNPPKAYASLHDDLKIKNDTILELPLFFESRVYE